jgi:endonuclease/exonuclease/phosphatase family metal-dependent hydrolase
MCTIFSQPPQEVQNDLRRLSEALNHEIPEKDNGRNLLLATWNIRSFGSLTRKWTSTSNDSPKRDLRGLRAIAEIISRFDVVAVQEVVGDLRGLRDMMNFLGSDWSFLMTDITLGEAGHNERMAFIYNNRRVQPSGLACEIVIPPEWLIEDYQQALNRQFVRTPYSVSFRAGNTTFILLTAHIDYGNESAERIPELKAIARWMYEWAQRTTHFHHNLLTLGDFNIDRAGDDLYEAFHSTGLEVPQDLTRVPRTIFADPDNPTLDKYYDQIAWFSTHNRIRLINMNFRRGGYFNFIPYVYSELNLSLASLSFRISDHFPLWVEFGI